MLWLVSVVDKYSFHVQFFLEQIVVFFVPEWIVMFVVLELNVELYPGEARLFLLEAT